MNECSFNNPNIYKLSINILIMTENIIDGKIKALENIIREKEAQLERYYKELEKWKSKRE